MRKRVLLTIVFTLFAIIQVCAVSSRYVYNTLSNKDKKLYDRMDEAIQSCIEKIDVTGYSKEDCIRIYSDYLDDHPGVFWADTRITYSTGLEKEGNVTHGVMFSYTHQDHLNADKLKFVNLVDYFHNYIKDDINDWFKLYHIYGYLASTIVYDNNYMDQSMWSVFFNGIGVCAGFARSFQYLALLEGIPCLIVTGYERDGNGNPGTVRHAWCMAQINGEWYHFDPTWGIKDSNGNIDYTYFCRSQERIEKTHVIDNEYPLPKSESDSLSYISVRHRYLEKYSRETIKEIVQVSFRRNEKMFSMEFASREELEVALKDLVTNKGINTIISELGMNPRSFFYSYNLNSCTLTFSF